MMIDSVSTGIEAYMLLAFCNPSTDYRLPKLISCSLCPSLNFYIHADLRCLVCSTVLAPAAIDSLLACLLADLFTAAPRPSYCTRRRYLTAPASVLPWPALWEHCSARKSSPQSHELPSCTRPRAIPRSFCARPTSAGLCWAAPTSCGRWEWRLPVCQTSAAVFSEYPPGVAPAQKPLTWHWQVY